MGGNSLFLWTQRKRQYSSQSSNSSATKYPTSGEIDIMPYYTDWLPYYQRNRVAAADKDVIYYA
jgi:hypothetical protein